MKVSCLTGSPRRNGNSAAIAARFTATAKSPGAPVETTVLNNLSYRGCQGCMACKTDFDRCIRVHLSKCFYISAIEHLG